MSIEYRDEEVRKQIYSGSYPLDNLHLSEREQREKILDDLRMNGISIGDESTLEVVFDGVDGTSYETQVIPYEVFRITTERVPYEVNREEIFSGTYISDDSAITLAQQREKAFDLMRQAGIEVEDESTLEVRFEMIDASIETQTISFKIFRVSSHKVEEEKENEEVKPLEEESHLEEDDSSVVVEEHTLEEDNTSVVAEDDSLDSDDKELLERKLAILREVKEKLEKANSRDEVRKLLQSLEKRLERLSDIVDRSRDELPTLKAILNDFDLEIKKVQKDLKKQVKEFDKTYQKMQEVIDEQNQKLNSSQLLSDDELKRIQEELLMRKEEINAYSVSIKQKISDNKKLLEMLKKKKNKFLKTIEEALKLDLSVADVNELEDTLQKRNIFNAILEQKGLGRLLSIKASERTMEESELLKIAKEKVIDELAQYKKEHPGKSVLDSIEALYSLQVLYKKGRAPQVIPIPSDALDHIVSNVDDMPVKIIDQKTAVDYEPSSAPADLEGVVHSDVMDKITIYRNPNGESFVRENVFTRFNFARGDKKTEIDGIVYYQLKDKDAEFIIQNADNDYSPYHVDFKDFSIDDVVNAVELEETNEVDSSVASEEPSVVEEVVEEKVSSVQQVELTLYSINDGNQVYVQRDVLDCFEIKPSTAPRVIENKEYYPIGEYAMQMIRNYAKIDPKYVIRYASIKEPVKLKPHAETVIQKLTDNLVIKSGDAKRYIASNLRATRAFSEELHSGEWAYNVVHFVPAVGKVGTTFLRKISGKLMLSNRGKAAMVELQRRLDGLSREDLEVLFQKYRSSQIGTDKNSQIDLLVTDRLRLYALEKVKRLNNRVRSNYAQLFVLIGEIKALEDRISKEDDQQAIEALNIQRRKFLSQGASYVKAILNDRETASQVLNGGGIQGLKEDFKAISSQLSYISTKFDENGVFNHELQEVLAGYGQGLNDALFNKDDEKIVSNFLGLESCHYKNSDILSHLSSKKPVGTKYYPILADEFGYQDDAFIQNLFTNTALTSAAVNFVNTVRMHAIELPEVEDDYFESICSMMNDTNYFAYYKFIQQVITDFNRVSARYVSGMTDRVSTLREISQVAHNTHASLGAVINDCLSHVKIYAKEHSEIDFASVKEAMQYIFDHPTTISNMNFTDFSNGLSGLPEQHIKALSSLPHDVLLNVLAAASSAGLAIRVSSSMTEQYKKGDYTLSSFGKAR